MTKEEKIEELKKLYDESENHPITHCGFTIPDNCPGDGWDGILCDDGAYCYGNNHFEGEFIKFEDMDEDLIDTILDEAEFNF